jgi:hypothetical protein
MASTTEDFLEVTIFDLDLTITVDDKKTVVIDRSNLLRDRRNQYLAASRIDSLVQEAHLALSALRVG